MKALKNYKLVFALANENVYYLFLLFAKPMHYIAVPQIEKKGCLQKSLGVQVVTHLEDILPYYCFTSHLSS